jgi:competence protein ComEA
MRLYFSRLEQVVVAVLVLAILGALVTLAVVRQRGVAARTAEPFLEGAVPAVDTPTPAARPAGALVVHVTGAVKKPGVYSFAYGARINDAIAQAGGPRADGYPDALNLAAKLVDGQRISVPTKAEWAKLTAAASPPLVVTPAPVSAARDRAGSLPAPRPSDQPVPGLVTSAPAVQSATPIAAAATATTPPARPAGPVNVNTATAAQLDAGVKGIGPAMAQRIVDYRTAHGPYASLDELDNVKGIGVKTLEKLKPQLTL